MPSFRFLGSPLPVREPSGHSDPDLEMEFVEIGIPDPHGEEMAREMAATEHRAQMQGFPQRARKDEASDHKDKAWYDARKEAVAKQEVEQDIPIPPPRAVIFGQRLNRFEQKLALRMWSACLDWGPLTMRAREELPDRAPQNRKAAMQVAVAHGRFGKQRDSSCHATRANGRSTISIVFC